MDEPTHYTYPGCRGVADHAARARSFLKCSQANAARVNATLAKLRDRLRQHAAAVTAAKPNGPLAGNP